MTTEKLGARERNEKAVADLPDLPDEYL